MHDIRQKDVFVLHGTKPVQATATSSAKQHTPMQRVPLHCFHHSDSTGSNTRILHYKHASMLGETSSHAVAASTRWSSLCRYQEHTFKTNLELSLNPKATLAWDAASKQSPGSVGMVEVPVVTVRPQTHAPVHADFGDGSSPCTVEIMRQPRHTLLCNAISSLGESMRRRASVPAGSLL